MRSGSAIAQTANDSATAQTANDSATAQTANANRLLGQLPK
jgi:hypothetical protein